MSEVLKEFLIDFTVNVYETIAGFSLILGLFRFSFNKTYFINTVIASIVMAQTSYLLRYSLGLPYITSVFMLAWIVVFLWQLFRIHPFYASLMAVTGYMTYVTVQDLLLMLLWIFFDIRVILANFNYGKLLQIVSSSFALLIYFLITRRRIGFSFVPDRFDTIVKFNGIHLALLIMIIVSVFAICFISLIALQYGYLLPIVTVTFMFLLIYLTYLNERSRNS